MDTKIGDLIVMAQLLSGAAAVAALTFAFVLARGGVVHLVEFGNVWVEATQERARVARLQLALEALRRLDPHGVSHRVVLAEGALADIDPQTRALVASFAALLEDRVTSNDYEWAPVGLGMSGRVRRTGEKALAEVVVGVTVLQLVVERKAKLIVIKEDPRRRPHPTRSLTSTQESRGGREWARRPGNSHC